MSSKTKILVIDDELIVLKSCERILSEAGYEIETAQSSPQGLKLVDEGKFDVVLTDLKMPEISGMEVLKTVRESHPDVIVIMITGYSTIQTAVEAMKLGAADYISKPFTPEELLDAISKAL